MVRRRLYQRLQRLVEQKGDGPLTVIASLIQEAEGPKVRDKGQYFCFVVKRRLAEAGWPIDAPPFPRATLSESRQLLRAVAAAAVIPAEDPAPVLDLPSELQRRVLAERAANDKLRGELAELKRRMAAAPAEGGAW